VEGFPDLSSQLAFGADLVVLAVCMRGAPFWGTSSNFELVYHLSWSFYCIRFLSMYKEGK
jgi:hypothetical protein